MKLLVKKATTDVTVYVFIQNSSLTTGAGLTGLVFNSASLVCYYVRPLGSATALTLATQTVTGAHSDGGFVEVDATNMPGVYRLDLSDAICATGVNSVVVMLKGATNMAPVLLEIQLVSFDPNDSAAMGMTLVPANVTQFGGSAGTFASGRPEVNLSHIAGSAVSTSTAQLGVNVVNFGGSAGTFASGRPEVNMSHLGGSSQSAADLKDFADDGYDPTTNKVQGVVLVDTLTTYTGNTPQTGDSFARLGAPAGASVSADIAAIEAQTDDIGAAGAGLTAIPWNAAWDAEVQSEVDDALVAQRLDELLNADSDIDGAAPPTVGSVFHELMTKTAGSFTYDQATDSLEAVRDKETDIETDTQDIQGRLPAALVSGRIDSSVGAMASNVVTAAAIATDAIDSDAVAASAVTEIQAGLSTLDASGVRSAVGLASANLDTQLSGINSKTTNLPSDPADASDIAASFATLQALVDDLEGRLTAGRAALLDNLANLTASPPTAAQILAQSLAAESYAADGAVPTLSQMLYMLWSAVGEFSIAGVTLTCKKLDGSTTAMTFTLDDATNPTSRTRAT